MSRTILHSDLNNFYASVECRDNPLIRHLPVAVVGDSKLRHGIVLAKNYLAKEYDIKTGEPIVMSLKKCKNLVLIKGDLKKYAVVSKQVREIYARFTDNIVPFGIDEAWLDVTHSLKMFNGVENIANTIKESIKQELGVTVSIGVSYNRVFAKIGSELKKPDAISYINRENYREKVWTLPAKELLYVGNATNERLKKYGIYTIGDIANADINFMVSVFGKWGKMLNRFANGYDEINGRTFAEVGQVKSIGNSNTAPRDLENLEDVSSLIYVLAESVATRLRVANLYCGGVQISVRKNTLCAYTASHIESFKYNDSKTIANSAIKLFKESYVWDTAIRSIGIAAINLSATCHNQLSFIDSLPYEKNNKLDRVVDKIRDKYGYESVKRGIVFANSDINALNPLKDNIVFPESYFSAKSK